MSNWIRVEDRLPESHELVLANGIEFLHPKNFILFYDRNDSKWKFNIIPFPKDFPFEVTHWMPLPNPPK